MSALISYSLDPTTPVVVTNETNSTSEADSETEPANVDSQANSDSPSTNSEMNTTGPLAYTTKIGASCQQLPKSKLDDQFIKGIESSSESQLSEADRTKIKTLIQVGWECEAEHQQTKFQFGIFSLEEYSKILDFILEKSLADKSVETGHHHYAN